MILDRCDLPADDWIRAVRHDLARDIGAEGEVVLRAYARHGGKMTDYARAEIARRERLESP